MAYANKEDHYAFMRLYRQRCKAEGRCHNCTNAAAEGRVLCDACREKHNARKRKQQYWRTHERNRKAAGLCCSCSSPTENGARLCVSCSNRQSTRRMALYYERKEQHLCVSCGDRLPQGHKHVSCNVCREIKAIKDSLRRTDATNPYL